MNIHFSGWQPRCQYYCRALLIVNLDENKKYRIDYAYRSYYESLDEHFDQLNLVQLVEFETWSRLVQGTWRSSILDHVYTNDGTVINELNAVDSVIGDHKILTFKLKE